MTLALLVMGGLFGVALAVTLALFGILSMGGNFSSSFHDAVAECRRRLTGRSARPQSGASARAPDLDSRSRGLQEEVKVMQRLLDQARRERSVQTEQAITLGGEVTALRSALMERERQLETTESALREITATADTLREELACRSADLGRSQRELKDLQTELSLTTAEAMPAKLSEELQRVRSERDELAARPALTHPTEPARSELAFLL